MRGGVGAGELDGRVILVAGAGGGLGAAAATACARAGATVVLIGRRLPRLNRVYDAVAAAGPEPLLYPMDLEGATPDDHAELAQRIEAGLGRLDGVLHCAAEFAGLTPFEHADPARFARAIHVNLTARAWLSQACLPLLKRQPDAALVFVVDAPERVGRAYWGGYGAAQFGLRGLIASLHDELAGGPVRVSGLQPPAMRSALRARAFNHQDDAEAVEPSAVAGACVELLADAGGRWRGQVRELAGQPSAMAPGGAA